MAAGRTGLATGRGFYDYRSVDVHAYRQARMRAFVAQLPSYGPGPPARAAEREPR